MSVLHDYAAAVSQPTLPLSGAPETGRYDEVVGGDGALRPAWESLASLALALTPEELARVDGEIARFLADDGVSYLRAGGTAQPWQLDPMPLVIDAAGWGRLDVGLAQRAELLNAILLDLYGPQTLLRRGVIPPAVVLGHSGFTRAIARPSAFDPHPLLLSAADLGRDGDGNWHVLADRVQAPSGLGFAAENRRVISQVLPDLFQESSLHRIDPYFSALRAALLSSAPAGVADPHVVILSPGTYSETAFDQAFLANALGFPLVQGNDLVVRDGWVWMKPAQWPATAPTDRIDVIIRRVDAEWCDPLEMRGDSRLGVAGLSEAVRRGHVRLVNGLGAGVLENPGLMPFLGAACEHLLGEQLRLPSVPTWWCGDAAARERVLERLSRADPTILVRTIDEPRKTFASVAPEELCARIHAEPHRFVGQDVLALSQAPIWQQSGRAAALPMTFRAFTLRYGAAYRPMHGGLATFREHVDALPRTKDVWVLKASVAEADQHLAEIAPLLTARTIPPLAPRALADMFWTGRYAERAEDLLRLALTAQAEIDQPGAHAAERMDESIRVLMAVIARLAGRRWDDPDAEFRDLLLDAHRSGTAAHAIVRLREAMEGVRDQLSGDTWRLFANVDRAARALTGADHPHRTAESASRMLTALLSLYGVTANMIRDTGWHMIEAGRFLERGVQLTHLLSALSQQHDPRAERDVLEALLVSAESVVTYRRRYRGSLRVADALDLLLLDQDNPRSLAFALDALRTHLAAMPASTGSTRAERLLDHLESDLLSTDVAELGRVDDGRRDALTAALADIASRLAQLADAIGHQHFESGPPPMPLSDLSLIELTGARA
ncbi:MAG: circularly permuted type 2 ATP-grasp protein [Microbacterium sp.]